MPAPNITPDRTDQTIPGTQFLILLTFLCCLLFKFIFAFFCQAVAAIPVETQFPTSLVSFVAFCSLFGRNYADGTDFWSKIICVIRVICG
jgi:hypothetical protein